MPICSHGNIKYHLGRDEYICHGCDATVSGYIARAESADALNRMFCKSFPNEEEEEEDSDAGL